MSDRLDDIGEVRLRQPLAKPQRRSIPMEEYLCARRPAREAARRSQRIGEIILDHDSLASETHRRRRQFGQGQFVRAILAQSERQPRDCSRDADGKP